MQVTRATVFSEAEKNKLTVGEKRQVLALAISTLRDMNPHRFQHLNYLNIDPLVELEALDNFLLTSSIVLCRPT